MVDIIPNWHPVFVHFTVALLITATALHVLSRFMPNSDLASQLTIAARWNLRIGVAATLFTAAAGWYAYFTVAHDAPSHIAMTDHRNWAMATLAVFLGIAGWEYWLSRRSKNKGWLFTGMLVVAAVLLLSTAWRGGELVYRYGLGVMSLPKAEGQGHNHQHGSMPMPSESALHAQGHDGAASPDTDAHEVAPPVSGTGAAPQKAGHAHTPGTPAHRD